MAAHCRVHQGAWLKNYSLYGATRRLGGVQPCSSLHAAMSKVVGGACIGAPARREISENLRTENCLRKQLETLRDDPDLGPVIRAALRAGPQSQAWLTAVRGLKERQDAQALALETGTCATSSFTHWQARVIAFAKVTDTDARRFAMTLLTDSFQAGATVCEIVPKLIRAGTSRRRGSSRLAILRGRRAKPAPLPMLAPQPMPAGAVICASRSSAYSAVKKEPAVRKRALPQRPGRCVTKHSNSRVITWQGYVIRAPRWIVNSVAA